VAGWLFLLPGCLTGIPADRMLYLPTLIFLPWAVWKLSKIPGARALKTAICAACVALGSVAFVTRGALWGQERALFETLVHETPWDAESHNHLADAYHRLGAAPGIPDTAKSRWSVSPAFLRS